MSHRILIVDDSSSDVELLLVVLRLIVPQVEAVVARDGQEALDLLFPKDGRSPDVCETLSLILLDIKMPKIDGLEVLSAIKDDVRARIIPVVMFTSSSEDRDIETAYRSGANGYVVKPVDFTEYQTLLKSIVGYWLEANRRPRTDLGSVRMYPHPAT